MDRDTLLRELRVLLVEELDLRGKTPEDIAVDVALFGDGLGLDSLDALQLAVAVEERYGVTLPDDERARAIFASVNALADHLLGALERE